MLRSLHQLSAMQFVCERCSDAPAKPLPPMLTPTNNDKLTDAIERLTNAVVALEGRFLAIEEKVGCLETRIPTREQVVDTVVETVERREHRNQLVMCGAPETEENDIDYVGRVFNEIRAVGCEPAEVFRLGRPTDTQERPRPRLMKIRFNRTWQRDTVLEKAKSLRDSTNFQGVYVRPSHTTRERRHIAGLYAQKRAMEQNGEFYYIRRHGPVEEWELVRSEPRTRRRNDTTDDTDWQTVPSRRPPQFVPNVHPSGIPSNDLNA